MKRELPSSGRVGECEGEMTREKRTVRKGESEPVWGMNLLFMLVERAGQEGRASERKERILGRFLLEVEFSTSK